MTYLRLIQALILGMFSWLPAQEAPSRSLVQALADPGVQKARQELASQRGVTATLLANLGAISAPSGQERARAEAVAAEMRAIGLQEVRVDGAPNALGRLPGRSGKALVFVATLDDLVTVAEHQKAAKTPPWVEGDRVRGPGVHTASTCAAMLAAARALVGAGLTPEHDLLFAAVAQEETGMLGMRELYRTTRDRALAYVDILGDGRSLSYGAIVIHWWKVVAHGPAGHTLGGGLPNVNQALARAVDRIFGILEAMDPEVRKVTGAALNIGMLQSGAVFNHKPATGWCSLDLRALELPALEAMEAKVRKILEEVAKETALQLTLEPFQMTPGGQLPGARDSALVRTSETIARHLGLEPRLGNGGSSNMNIAIGGGTPALGLGGERGGHRGTPEEFADIPAMMRSAEHVLLLAATLGGGRTAR